MKQEHPENGPLRSGSTEQQRHERLCALLFGEVDPAERARIEAELAEDPELRAEHDRLAATIELVRDAVPASDALSTEAREALTAAAQGREAGAPDQGLAPILPWPARLARSPQFAAAAVVLMLGTLAGLASQRATSGSRLAADTARVELLEIDAEEDVPAVTMELNHRGAGVITEAPSSAPLSEESLADFAPSKANGAIVFDDSGDSDGGFYRGPGDSVPSRSKVKAVEREVVELAYRAVATDEVAGVSPLTEALDGAVEDPMFDLDALTIAGLGGGAGSAPPEEAEFSGLVDRAIQVRGLGSTSEQEVFAAELGVKALLAEGGVDPATLPARDELTASERGRLMQLGYAGGSVSGGGGGQERAVELAARSVRPLSTGAAGGGPSSPGPSGPSSPGAAPPGPATPGLLAKSLPSSGGGSDGFFLGQSPPPQPSTDPTLAGRAFYSDSSAGDQLDSLGELLANTSLERGRRRAGSAGESPTIAGGVFLYSSPSAGQPPSSESAFGLYAPSGQPITADDIITFCRIRPQESPRDMFYRCWGDNPFEWAATDRLSTFAADVDTASYALARNYLARGHMPTKEQIRTEEFVNSFDSGVPAPHEGVFDIDLEMAPSLFGSRGEWMLRVVVRGQEVDKLERPPLALTFVVDVSGSMKEENRLELVKHALRLLVGELDQNDAIAIVAFSNEARLILPMTSAGNKAVIESAIFGLNPDGGTNAEAGLMMGYAQASTGLTPGAANRVVLLSDGVANIGNVDEGTLLGNVERYREQGIYLNTIGVGMGNHNDALLEQLANKGDGICNYVDTQAEAMKVLVEDFTGQFVPIARDVKIQVEFDPAQVESYRLLGYENRAVADADFRNDAVDAGEVGAGHQVTALYELVRAPAATNDGPLAKAMVRYKPPFAVDHARLDAAAEEAVEVAVEIDEQIEFREVVTSFQGASVGFQRAALVAQFAEFLRRSVHARGNGYDPMVNEAIRLEKLAEDPQFTEFTTMIAQHRDLIVRNLPADDAFAQAMDELTRRNYLQGKQRELLEQSSALTDEILAELAKQNADIEAKIRELLEAQMQGQPRVK